MFSMLRQVGSFLRGNSTPFQIFATTVLAGILGFLPGFQQAPGLTLAALLLLFILKTNLFLAGITALVARLLGLALQPVSFALGRWMIDGPLSGLFENLINGPVTAWFGFENYVASGGLILGVVFGFIIGFVFSKFLSSFRRKMAALDRSEGFQAVSGNPFVRFVGWIFFGGIKAKEDWEAMDKKWVGRPFRWIGLIVAAIVVAGIVTSPYLIPDAWLAKVVREQVEPLNGATVDLESLQLDVAGGTLAIGSLGLCDPNDLEQNLFESIRLEASLSESDLLARKYAIDRLEVSGARVNELRETPGKRVGPAPKPAPDPDLPEGEGGEEDEEKAVSIEGAIEKADEWKARLAEVKKWIGKMKGSKEETGDEAGETLEERLERLAQELGYANVIASHRISEKPRFTIHELVVNGLTVRQLPGELLNVLGSGISTEPHLVEGSSTVEVSSESGRLGLALTLEAESGPVSFHYKELDVATVKGWLKDGSKFPFAGGHFNLQAEGTLTGGEVYLPIQVTAVGSQFQFRGKTFRAPETPFTVLVTGALDNPTIRPQLKGLLAGAKGELIEEGKSRVMEKIDEKLGGKLDGILGGDKDGGGAGGALDSFLKRRQEKKQGN